MAPTVVPSADAVPSTGVCNSDMAESDQVYTTTTASTASTTATTTTESSQVDTTGTTAVSTTTTSASEDVHTETTLKDTKDPTATSQSTSSSRAEEHSSGERVGTDTSPEDSTAPDSRGSSGDTAASESEQKEKEEEDDWSLTLRDFLSAMSTEPELMSFFERRLPLPSMTFRMMGASSRK